LIRGQWRRLDARLRIHVGIVVALLAVFAFWQLRLRYAELALFDGRSMAGGVLLGTLGAIAAVGAAGTGMRLRSRLRRAPRGPEWAALPATGEQLVAHQAYEAELPLRLLWALALADWIAALPAASVLALAAAPVLFPATWVAFVALARQGVAAGIARRVPAVRREDAHATLLASLAEAWAVRDARHGDARGRSGSWKRTSATLALFAKDVRLARRSRATWPSLALAALLTTLSMAAWRAPTEQLRPAAFALALLALAAYGEWLIAIGGRDPFAVLRGLPASVGTIWSARAVLGAAATLAIVLGQAVASGGRAAPVSLAWLMFAGLAVTALAINVQLTLFPKHGAALRVFGLALTVVVVCTFVVPVVGWIVLLAAVYRSARKLAGWWTLEDLG